MSETQSYKTVTFDTSELLAVAHALDSRIITLYAMAHHSADRVQIEKLIVAASSARAKIEAAL
jgi:hypothetical protein